MRVIRDAAVKPGHGVQKEVVGDGEIPTQEHFDQIFRKAVLTVRPIIERERRASIITADILNFVMD